MAHVVFNNGYMTVSIKHVIKRADGSFFYQRRVPKGLEGHHGGKSLIRQSLQTKSPKVAAQKAQALAREHDALWRMLRSPGAVEEGLTTRESREGATALLKSLDLRPGEAHSKDFHDDPLDDYLTERYGEDYLEARYGERHDDQELERLLNPIDREALKQLFQKPGVKRHFLSDALALYLRDHNNADKTKFVEDTTRNIQHVIDAVGDLPLDKYEREHARRVLDALMSRGRKTGTVRRQIRAINAVFNYGLREFDFRQLTSPFRELKIKGEGQDAEERPPFTVEELKTIQRACCAKDDDIRHIIAMQSDTGSRAGEVIGLRVEDINLKAAIPHVWFRQRLKLGRRLKTVSSERKVPLVGMALWAAKRAVESATKHPSSNGWLFPRYASDGDIKATHAENTMNRWLRSLPGVDKTTHSFRHTMRDRLREVRAPEEIQNDVGGWGGKTIGQSYGEGYTLERMQEYLQAVVLATG